jgi:hypothetical protein
VTPSGIEAGPNVTENRRVTALPTDPPAAARPKATLQCNECNECNEAREAMRDGMARARRLALVAENALLNGDLQRALTALRDLSRDGTRGATNSTLPANAVGATLGSWWRSR